MSENFRCVTCGCEHFEALYRALPDLHLEHPSDYRADLVRCTTCSLIAQWPQPDDAELAGFYPEEYSPYRRASRTKTTAWRLRRFLGSLFGALLSDRVLRHRHSGRLLDVGCSSGGFLLEMTAVPGWECVGIEIGHAAAEAARSQGLEVHGMDLNRLEPSAALGLFDVVTMWDVLEHLRNPVDALRRIGAMLKPEGFLMIGVPNFASFEARLFGRHWSGIEAPRHLYVFDPHTMRTVVESAGYELVEIRTGIGLYSTLVNTFGFWLRGREVPYRTAKRIERLLRLTVLRRMFEPLMQLGACGLHGSKMIAVARRAG